MPQLHRIESTASQTSGDQLLATAVEDGVKAISPLFADRGSIARASTGSLSRSTGVGSAPTLTAPRKLPAVDGDQLVWKRFQAICDAILREVRRIKPAVGLTDLPDDWVSAAAEIEGLVQELYDVSWGKKDALKRVVVKVEGQINNAIWNYRHVGFLEDVFVALRNRYSIDDTTVREVAELVKCHDLPLFRGSLSADDVRKQYQLVEFEPNDDPE